LNKSGEDLQKIVLDICQADLFIYNISFIIVIGEVFFINSDIHMIWLFSRMYISVIRSLQDLVI